LDQCTYQSGLYPVSTAYKMVISLITLLLTLLLNHPLISLYGILSALLIQLILGRIPIKAYFSFMKIPLSFIVIGTIAIGFNVCFAKNLPLDADILGHIQIGSICFYTSRSLLYQMLSVSLKAFSAVSCMYLITLTTPCSQVIHTLHQLKIPTLLTELMHLVYRYIFLILALASQMNTAASSRLGYRSYKQSLKTFSIIGSSLLITSLKKSNDYYNALESRCYNGNLRFLQSPKILNAGWIAGGLFYVLSFIALKVIVIYH